MKLIVGLGNPGKEYENTRHNMGFMAIDYYAKNKKIVLNKEKFGGVYTEFIYNNEKIILLKPQSYINLSGDVIKKFVDYYKIQISDILIISDDLDLNVGTLKLKYKGGSGGHNGLKNIENQLKTKEYKRVKIGISNDKKTDTKDYVLSQINSIDKEVIDKIIKTISDIIDDFLVISFDNLMNKYNK
ncbi:MAG: aminoacyl-tRNA hydrolase [Bacilli bacterium]|nr:aminoacyl-tRNA hydrolase [Bacilli bacterium]